MLLEQPVGELLAFASAQPTQGEEADAYIRFVAVHPRVWGQGFGARLMRALPAHLRELGFDRAHLTVYPDNERAVDLYEAAGWRATGELSVNERSGRAMARYELVL